VNYHENAAIAAHAIRISCNCKDNSPILLYQVYQSACEPAVFFSNRMARVSGVSGVSGVSPVSDKFESKWLTVSRVSGVSGVSGVSLFQVCSVFGADTEQIAPFNFGVAEFILTFVVDAVVVGQFGSWMISVSLSFFLRGEERVVNHPGDRTIPFKLAAIGRNQRAI